MANNVPDEAAGFAQAAAPLERRVDGFDIESGIPDLSGLSADSITELFSIFTPDSQHHGAVPEEADELFKAVSEEALRSSSVVKETATDKQVGSDLLTVIHRQDTAIKCLLSWCQRFADDARVQRTQLAVQQETYRQATKHQARLQTELEIMKSCCSPTNATAEVAHSASSRELNAALAAKVNALPRASSLCGTPVRQRQQPRTSPVSEKAKPPHPARSTNVGGKPGVASGSPRQINRPAGPATARSTPSLHQPASRTPRPSCMSKEQHNSAVEIGYERATSPSGVQRTRSQSKERPGMDVGRAERTRVGSVSAPRSRAGSPLGSPRQSPARGITPRDLRSPNRSVSPSQFAPGPAQVSKATNSFRYSQNNTVPGVASPRSGCRPAQQPMGSPTQKLRTQQSPQGTPRMASPRPRMESPRPSSPNDSLRRPSLSKQLPAHVCHPISPSVLPPRKVPSSAALFAAAFVGAGPSPSPTATTRSNSPSAGQQSSSCTPPPFIPAPPPEPVPTVSSFIPPPEPVLTVAEMTYAPNSSFNSQQHFIEAAYSPDPFTEVQTLIAEGGVTFNATQHVAEVTYSPNSSFNAKQHVNEVTYSPNSSFNAKQNVTQMHSPNSSFNSTTGSSASLAAAIRSAAAVAANAAAMTNVCSSPAAVQRLAQASSGVSTAAAMLSSRSSGRLTGMQATISPNSARGACVAPVSLATILGQAPSSDARMVQSSSCRGIPIVAGR